MLGYIIRSYDIVQSAVGNYKTVEMGLSGIYFFDKLVR